MLPLVAIAALALIVVAATSGRGHEVPPIPVKITGKSKRDRLSMLLPPVRARFQELQQWAAGRLGVILIPGSTGRTHEEQVAEFEKGHSATKNLGFHGVGAAIDMYLVDQAGKLLSWSQHEPTLKKIVAKAQDLGFRSLAYNADGSRKLIRTKRGMIWDAGHIEWRNPETIAMVAEARRAYA